MNRIGEFWMASLMVLWLIEIPVLAVIGACWGISTSQGELIGAISVAPFLFPVLVFLIAFFAARALEALRGDRSDGLWR